MADHPLDLVIVDCETLGLHPDAPVWEFAAQRRVQDPSKFPGWDLKYTEHGPQIEACFTIDHDPKGWLDDLPPALLADYHGRFNETTAWCETVAASEIRTITNGALLIGCNPGYDTERLAKLLQRHGFEPGWHYHPYDSASIAVGYLAARGELMEQPWKSDQLSAAVGVDSVNFQRHTAMGDVLWVAEQLDKVMATNRQLRHANRS